MSAPQRRWWESLALVGSVFVVGAMALAALFGNEFRSQDWDPMHMRVSVLRAMHFGGTFYEAGPINKGPLEPLVYRVAAALTSYEGYWYAISAFVLIAAAVLAWAASRTTQAVGGHRLLGVAIGVAVFFHFTLSRADYAGTLYSRNMIVALYAGAWLVALNPRWWTVRRAPWAAGVVGVLLGLGIQTLFVSTIAACGVAALAWSSIDAVDNERSWRLSRRVLLVTPVVVVLSAPAYYALRGSFDEFWGGYWTYNVFQNEATGRSLASQLVLGRDVVMEYYRAWPASLLIVVGFVALSAALWVTMNRRTRVIHAALAVWFVGAWAELVAGQRYSSHYYSVLALPTALMGAVVIGHAFRLVSDARGPTRTFRTAACWPLIAALVSIAAWGGQYLTQGLQAASRFDGVHSLTMERTEAEPGKQRTVRAVLDLASTADDPLLAWTEYPWVYLNYRRTAATRFIWKSFLVGEIYLARSSPDYVLAHTWERFAEDMAQARPAVLLTEIANPVAEDTPFAAYVAANFQQVYANADNVVSIRNDVAAALFGAGDDEASFTPSIMRPGSSWELDAASARWTADAVPDSADRLLLADARCTTVSGTYQLDAAAAETSMSFRLDGPTGTPTMRLNVVGNEFVSGNDSTVFDTTTIGDEPLARERTFSLVVGDRSAALIVDGEIRAAVRLDGHTTLSVEMRSGGVVLADLRQAPTPAVAGC